MLTLNHPDGIRGRGLSRRDWLRIGSLGALGGALPGVFSQGMFRPAIARGGQHDPPAKAKACIVIMLLGGPPQHETWDPKMDAPLEVRGNLKAIDSATPGLSVGELMPLTAKLTDKIAVLRAMSTYDSAHSSSGYWMLTGNPHQPTNQENALPGPPNNLPSLGAIATYLRAEIDRAPTSITLPEDIWNTGGIRWPGQNAGALGRRYDPWLLTCDPNEADFRLPGVSISDELKLVVDSRKSLLDNVNSGLDEALRAGTMSRWDNLTNQTFDLLSSAVGREAFDMRTEPDALRDRYGRCRFGQSMLLARRLVEAGIKLVQVNWTRAPTDENVNPVWDTHAKNEERLRTALMPPMDQSYSALLEDLSQRGLLDETLVVWMGEFGRTPKINPVGGRDHWGPVFSVALAGGGVRGGVVHGASDKLGAHPREGKHEPQDLSATIFHLLGHDPAGIIHDALGRPLPVSRGEPIAQIL